MSVCRPRVVMCLERTTRRTRTKRATLRPVYCYGRSSRRRAYVITGVPSASTKFKSIAGRQKSVITASKWKISIYGGVSRNELTVGKIRFSLKNDFRRSHENLSTSANQYRYILIRNRPKVLWDGAKQQRPDRVCFDVLI